MITYEQADQNLTWFETVYPIAKVLAFRFANTTANLYPNKDISSLGEIKGAYSPNPIVVNGKTHIGRVDLVLGNASSPQDFIETLKHEVLGHFGLNTFSYEGKKVVLEAILKTKQQEDFSKIWEKVNRVYSNAPPMIQAEEIFAISCEKITRTHFLGNQNIAQLGQKSFEETCLAPIRLMQIEDLQNIACMVAQGLHDRTRTQQYFPDVENIVERKAAAPKKELYEVVAERLIEQLKQGTAPWQKPWIAGNPGMSLPINAMTGDRYTGSNTMTLLSQGYSDPRWMTYKQAQLLGAHVRAGETGTHCVRKIIVKDQLNSDEKAILGRDGKPIQRERSSVKTFSLFNAEQIEGLSPLPPLEPPKWNPIDRAEQIMIASGVTISHSENNRAFYQPSTDSIHLPGKNQFTDAGKYYATALHELGHWTGHESRLNRDLSNAHGSEGYAREELRAEIASMLLGAEIGIGHDGGQHASYVASWIKVLEENPKEIFDATRDAEKIQNFVLGLEKNINQEIDTDDLKRHFKEMTLGREVRAFEYKDGSDEWEALPEDLKSLIEEHNSLPEALQNDFFEKTISNPQVQTLISKGIEALEVCEENDLSL